jgi:hypothetical protein
MQKGYSAWLSWRSTAPHPPSGHLLPSQDGEKEKWGGALPCQGEIPVVLQGRDFRPRARHIVEIDGRGETPSPSPPSTSTRPQGSTISGMAEAPGAAGELAPLAGRHDEAAVLDGAARFSTCQCASPVTLVKAAGTLRISAPAWASLRIEQRKSQVVADRKPDRGVGEPREHGVGLRARSSATRGRACRQACRCRRDAACRSAPRFSPAHR